MVDVFEEIEQIDLHVEAYDAIDRQADIVEDLGWKKTAEEIRNWSIDD